MKLRIWIALLWCALAVAANAQTINLIGTINRPTGGHAFNGKFCLTPSDANGSPLQSWSYGGGGQGVGGEVCFQIAGGALQSGVTVPDTAQTWPRHMCLYARFKDPTLPVALQVRGSFPCLQPASTGQSWCSTTAGVTTCDLNSYIASQATIPLIQTGPGINWRGAWVSTTAYGVNDAVSYNGSAYISTQTNNTNAPNGIGWSLLASGGSGGGSNLPDVIDNGTTVSISKPVTITGSGQTVMALGAGAAGSAPSGLPSYYSGLAGPDSGTPAFVSQTPSTAPTAPSVYVWQAPVSIGSVLQARSAPMQLAGTDGRIPTAGVLGGAAGTLICLDGNGGLTTVGCSTIPAATPTFSPASPYSGGTTSVTMADVTSGAQIFYCIGTSCTPTAPYTGSVSVSASESIRAQATATGYLPSAIASWTGTISSVAATPMFSPVSPYSGTATSITISDGTSGAAIEYCVDTTNTCTPATAYNTAISFGSTEYVRAQATATGYTASAIASWQGTIQAAANPVLVHHATMTSNAGTTSHGYTWTTGVTPTSGHLVAVAISLGDIGGTSISSVTDNLGNAYTVTSLAQNAGNTSSAAWAYSFITTGGSALSITVTLNQDLNHVALQMSEWSGVSALDISAGSTGTSTAATTSLTTANAVELVLGDVMDYSGQGFTPASGFTTLDTVGGYGPVVYAITSAVGPYTPGATLNNSTGWAAKGVAFK